MPKVTLLVCTNHRYSGNHPSCGARGGESVLQQLRIASKKCAINVEASCCFGHCLDGVTVKAAPNGSFYHHVTNIDIPKIVSDAIELNAKLQSST